MHHPAGQWTSRHSGTAGEQREETPRHDANLWTVQPSRISHEGRQATDSASEGDQTVEAERRDLAERQKIGPMDGVDE